MVLGPQSFKSRLLLENGWNSDTSRSVLLIMMSDGYHCCIVAVSGVPSTVLLSPERTFCQNDSQTVYAVTCEATVCLIEALFQQERGKDEIKEMHFQ